MQEHEVMQLSQKEIIQNARQRFANESLPVIALKQAFYENWLKLKKKVNFRHDENQKATSAYCAMTIKEFEGINARQSWANWRSVPLNLNGYLPLRPMKVIDLCCGIGQSTDVLAFYLPQGSEILGLEFNEEFVRLAQKRQYKDAKGNAVKAQFRAQSVLETFRDLEGQPIADASVDLVNSCGAVGAHFDQKATETLAKEVSRVLKKGGLAAIDSGPEGTSPEEVIRIFKKHGFHHLNQAKSCFLDRFTQICFQKK